MSVKNTTEAGLRTGLSQACPEATAARVKQATKVTLADRFKNLFSAAINPFLYPVYRGFAHKASKAEENAQLIASIGGEEHQLRSKDGAKVSVTYVSTEAFVQKVNEAGGRIGYVD